jgi:subtilisin family serine protease
MSLGGLEYRKAPTHEEKKLIDGYKLIYNAAFNFAKKQGITTVVSSGNFGYNFKGDKQYVRFMADFQAVLPINACGPRNWYPDNTHVNEDFYHVAAYSSTGQESEFCAPGGQIPDGSSDGDCYFDNGVFTATRPCWVFDLVFSTGGFQDGRWWWYWAAGTSMAAPHASGVAALIISEDIGRYRGKPALVRAEMRKRAVDKGKSGRDDIFGHGFVQSGY